jgi:hypothetical protein
MRSLDQVMPSFLKLTLITALAALAAPAAASAAPEIRTVSGASPAALEATIAAFRADLGELRPDGGQAYGGTGRREINWDGVPVSAAFPNRLPGGQFAGRGAEFSTPGIGTEVSNGSPWGGGFSAYSGEKLFSPVGSNRTDVRFNVPGSARQAFTDAFGIVLSDVDTAAGGAITFLDGRGATLLEVTVPTGQLSFVGVRFRDGERVAEVQVRSGSVPIAPGVVDTPQTDVAAIDDVIFGEPEADLFALPPELAATEFEPSPTIETPAVKLRASLIALAKRVRAGRTLKLVLGSSADATAKLTLGKTTRTVPLEAGATEVKFKVPAKAKRGKQKLRLTIPDAPAKSVSVTVI